MNSDISIRTSASFVSNKNSAKALHNSVLPTPVGPKNKKEPFGRLGSDIPDRDRRTALETAVIASLCPMTRWCRASSISNNRCLSLCNILLTGIPVERETTSAISSSVTRFLSSCFCAASASEANSKLFSKLGISPY